MREIRTLGAAEVETLVGWAAAEGWNPGIGDAPAFRTADPDGFLGAFVAGELVAGISAIAYGEDFGFIGLYICRPDRRGQGHGKAVWDAGMARLAGRTIGLDGVPEQQANYKCMGFVPAYETVRLTGVARGTPSDGIVACTATMLPDLTAFDRACFPGRRDAFLARWIEPPRVALADMTGGRLRGYGVVRPCVSGHKIGPLYAESAESAVRLLGALGHAAGGPVSIDVPAAKRPDIESCLAAATAGFMTARMYRGGRPAMDQHRVFGISTLELG